MWMLFAKNLRLENSRNVDFNENIWERRTYNKHCTFSEPGVAVGQSNTVWWWKSLVPPGVRLPGFNPVSVVYELKGLEQIPYYFALVSSVKWK